MKTPLNYQISEYDCGPVSLLNAVSYLFDQEEIPPDLIRGIYLYALDDYRPGSNIPGKAGTSAAAMRHLSYWMTQYGKTGQLPISSRYFSGGDIFFGADSPICGALRRGGVVILRLYLEVGHYVLLTGMQGDDILAFDPYYWEKPFADQDIRIVTDHPSEYNRVIPVRVLNSETQDPYALGPVALREAVAIFNDNKTISGGNEQ